ncbi:MAG: hypothetical protein OEY66_07935 [Gammaproteobacteria bacterium]|nr:hypothetical protein [Gammaproteobacteria bacterium]
MSRPSNCLFIIIFISGNLYAESYYTPRDYGSDSLYDPFGNFLSYSLDSLQVSDSFDTRNFRSNLDQVLSNLSHPKTAINNEGGFNRFINRQIFPVNSNHSDESWAILPNYGLHLLGGGMVFRKDLEYFRANGVENAAIYSITLAMTAELIQEAFEKKTTLKDDAVADFYLFRPLGIWLFNDDDRANYIMDTLDPAIWPYLQAFDFSEDHFINTGINYMYRPPATEFLNSRLFVFTGLNNQIGLSHRIDKTDWFSWGIGLSTQRIDFSLRQQAELDTSFGFFYDKNKSLLWSLVFNDAGGTDYRFNLFPTNQSLPGKFGYFISHNENQDLSLGMLYRIQIGISFTK